MKPSLPLELSVPVQLIRNLEQLFHHFFDLWILLFIWPSSQILRGDVSIGVLCVYTFNHIPRTYIQNDCGLCPPSLTMKDLFAVNMDRWMIIASRWQRSTPGKLSQALVQERARSVAGVSALLFLLSHSPPKRQCTSLVICMLWKDPFCNILHIMQKKVGINIILPSPRWIMCLKQVKSLEEGFYAAYKHVTSVTYLLF